MLLAKPNPNDITGDTIDLLQKIGNHTYFYGSVHIDIFYETPLYEIHTRLANGETVPISISLDVSEDTEE